jgi:hypothetical protein
VIPASRRWTGALVEIVNAAAMVTSATSSSSSDSLEQSSRWRGSSARRRSRGTSSRGESVLREPEHLEAGALAECRTLTDRRGAGLACTWIADAGWLACAQIAEVGRPACAQARRSRNGRWRLAGTCGREAGEQTRTRRPADKRGGWARDAEAGRWMRS